MKNSKIIFSVLLGTALPFCLQAQTGKTQWGQCTGQKPFPISEYQELPNWEKCDTQHWAKIKDIVAGWGSIDQRYAIKSIPNHKLGKSETIRGWRGERVYAQAVVMAPSDIQLNYKLTGFKHKNSQIPNDAFTIGFTRSVVSDAFTSGCGKRTDNSKHDSIFTPDPIDHVNKTLAVKGESCQGIWITCWIPENIDPATYKGTLDVYDGDRLIKKLPLAIVAQKQQLPSPQEWSYHLDLWQNPFSVSRYYQLQPWSKEHMEALRPVMKRLADAGQKTITVSMNHRPWDGQTEDAFNSMVTWIKKADGTWMFDYTVFDMWVELMMDLGIDQYISCYSMVPWKQSLTYFDQASNSMVTMDLKLSDPIYEEIWTEMLTSFASHLKEKGWMDKCILSMDERPLEAMRRVISIVRKVEPRFKFSLAGHHYNDQIGEELVDFSSSWIKPIPEEVLKTRQSQDKISTYYTCCTEDYPNTFTFSHPAEAAWISCRIAKEGLDGYLRWAYNSWTLEPLLDARFKSWSAGDTYIVYPENRSSIRFERLVDGIQLCEKVNILRKQYQDNPRKLKQIDKILAPFYVENLQDGADAAGMVRKAKEQINKL